MNRNALLSKIEVQLFFVAASVLFLLLTVWHSWSGPEAVVSAQAASAPQSATPGIVRHPADEKEVNYPWGWIHWRMSADVDPGAQQTFGIVQINAGQRNPLHRHPNCEEILYVLSGSFENVVNGKATTMHAGDLVRIPAGTPHQGINNTSQPMQAVISYSSGTRQMVALDTQTE